MFLFSMFHCWWLHFRFAFCLCFVFLFYMLVDMCSKCRIWYLRFHVFGKHRHPFCNVKHVRWFGQCRWRLCNSFPVLIFFANPKQYNLRNTRKNTWNVNEHSAIRMNERMRERLGFLGKWLPWDSICHCGWLYFCCWVLCVIRYVFQDSNLVSDVSHFRFLRTSSLWGFSSRLLEVDMFQISLFEFSFSKSRNRISDFTMPDSEFTRWHFQMSLFELLSFRVYRFSLNVRFLNFRSSITYYRLPVCSQNTLHQKRKPTPSLPPIVK